MRYQAPGMSAYLTSHESFRALWRELWRFSRELGSCNTFDRAAPHTDLSAVV